ncbi:hypothetical protein STEG23_038142, partial [Scotinomys teguina]
EENESSEVSITAKQPIAVRMLGLGLLLSKAWIFIQTFSLPVPDNFPSPPET